MFKVTLHYLDDFIQTVQVNKNPFIIGRKPSADIVITHEEVSRLHAKVEVTSEGLYLTDLSKNGVYVNGSRINKGSPVYVGFEDRIFLKPLAYLYLEFE